MKMRYVFPIPVKVILPAVFIAVVILGSSCKKWIDRSLNEDPSLPGNATVDVILPAAQAGMAWVSGGELRYAACLWTQQLTGGKGQMLFRDRYIYGEADTDELWGKYLYAGPMMDCYHIIKKSKAEGSPYYGGIARVMMAYMLGCAADMWGDIPYSQAFGGADNLNPRFDSQQSIYDTLTVILDEAIEAFNISPGLNYRFPGNDDLIYGGNILTWRKAAYALKARYVIHLSKVYPSTAYYDALLFLDDAFASVSDDMVFHYSHINGSNPFFLYNELYPGSLAAGACLVDSLLAMNDPRLPLLIDGSEGFSGAQPGSGNPASPPGTYYASPGSPVVFISYSECKFIEAEATFMIGDPDGAATAFNEAVKASLAGFGVSDAAWESVHANETGASISLAKIIQHKYFALCFQPEVYNDWRRTGYPQLVPAATGIHNEIPRRYPYPLSERVYNAANVPAAGPLIRVWWDVQ